VSDAAAVESTPLLCLLGSPHLRAGGRRHELPASAPGLLLACLAMQGDWVPRERLVALFWPHAPEADAQRQLRVTLHRARQQLQAWGLASHLHAEHGRLRLEIDCDVPCFRTACARSDWAEAVAWHGIVRRCSTAPPSRVSRNWTSG
jgi:DNA-binding SARP family transcriptional activator